MPQPCFHDSYATRHGDSLRGVFTMYESNKIRKDFIPEINDNFDFIIVPSDYCLKAFRETFPQIPIYKCPLGVNGYEFPLFDRPKDRHPFTFVWNGWALGGRKGDRACVEAFESLNLPDSRLIMKSMPTATIFNQWTHLAHPNGSKVFVLFPYTQAELYSLYCDSDVGLHPSSSEGFGMIPLEMMSTGLPVIMTACTASEEQFDESDCLEVTTTLSDNWAIKDGTLGHVADLDSLKGQMLYAYEHREEMRDRGRHAAERVRRDFSWERAAFDFEKILNHAKEGLTNGRLRSQGTGATAGEGEPCGCRA
jgi:glycosyltransferase involved in cell wall biosynthesis